MSTETQEWYVLEGGEQVGPFSPEQLASVAAGGSITPETQVWTEGLEDWIPAANVEGLFDAVAGAQAESVVPPPDAAPPPDAIPPPTAAQPAGGTVASLEYPRVGVSAASFPMLAGFVVGGLCLLLLSWFMSGRLGDRPDLAGQARLLVLLLLGLGVLCWLAAGVTQFAYLHRAWKCLQFGGPRTTPGKAVGGLLIPLFNYYWMFVAWLGFARDWNRVTSEFPDLRHAPKMPEQKFLMFCVLAIVLPPAALAVWFPVMGAMCRAINFMTFRPTHHLGPILLH